MDANQEVTRHPAELPVQPLDGTNEANTELTPDDIFSPENQVGDFFRAQLDDQPESKESVPQGQTTGEAQEEPNDTVRYQYWQSEADKARNENELNKLLNLRLPNHRANKRWKDSHLLLKNPGDLRDIIGKRRGRTLNLVQLSILKL